MIVPIAKGDEEIKTVQIRELKAWPSGVIEAKGWGEGEGEGEGSGKSHVLLSYTLVMTRSWTGYPSVWYELLGRDNYPLPFRFSWPG